MSSQLAIRLYPEPERTLAFGSISNAYTSIGVPFINPIRIFFLQNLTDQTLTFSFDGVTTHLRLPSNGYIAIDVTSNRTVIPGCFFAEGQRIFAAYATGAPTLGLVSLSVFYGAS